MVDIDTAQTLDSGQLAEKSRIAGRRSDHLGLLIALLVLSAFYTLTARNFLTVGNLTNVLEHVAYVGIIAWGMTLVIIAGEIDVSVGSAAAFAGVVLAMLLGAGLEPIPAVFLTLLVGSLIGSSAGAIRAWFAIPSFIVTLALYGILRGLALFMTSAIPQAPEAIRSEGFEFLGSGDVTGIPTSALIMIALFVVFWFVSTRMTFGKEVYAIGGNPDAAYLAGLPIARDRIVLFGITGLLAAVSGVLLAAALGAGDPSTSQGLEFEVIAAVIVGGTSLFGGRGSMVGTALGVLFIGILGNGLILLGVNTYMVNAVRGFVILVAVLLTSEGFRGRVWSLLRPVQRRS